MGTQASSSPIRDDAAQGQVGAQEGAGAKSRLGKIRRVAFKVVVVLALLLLLAAFNLVFLLIVVSWLPADMYLGIIGEAPAEVLGHRLHGSIIAVLAWSLLVGIAVQIRRPRVRQAPLLMVLAIPFVSTTVDLATGKFVLMDSLPLFIILGLLALLHPGARELIRFRRFNTVMGGLTAAAAAAWIPFAYEQARLQTLAVPGDAHAADGHWGVMATFAVLLVLWGLLGSSDRPGWRITAWMTGLASAWYGLQSMIFGTASAAALPWAIGAVVWGAAFIAAAERRARSNQEMTNTSESTTGSRAVQA